MSSAVGTQTLDTCRFLPMVGNGDNVDWKCDIRIVERRTKVCLTAHCKPSYSDQLDPVLPMLSAIGLVPVALEIHLVVQLVA